MEKPLMTADVRQSRGNVMQGATFSRRHILSAVSAVAVSAVLAEPLKAATPEPSGAGPEPTSWVDSAMPEGTHRMIEPNGIRLHVAEQADGPPIILCHRFPGLCSPSPPHPPPSPT